MLERRTGRETVAVLGCGALGAAIVRGLQHPEGRCLYDVIATQRTRERAEAVAQRLDISCEADNCWAVEHASIIVLAVRPESMLGLLKEISTAIPPGTLCITVAAGLPLHLYEENLPPDVPVIRALSMPMIVVRRGLVAMSASVRAEALHVEKARRLFGLLSEEALLVPERDLDLFAALHGSAAALVYRLVDALLEAAGGDAGRGFSARRVVAAMLAAVGHTLVESGESLRTLSTDICTSASSAADGIAVWEEGHVGQTVQAALVAILRRTADLGRDAR